MSFNSDDDVVTLAVIKAWIKSGTERGLHRAVLLLQSLALNGINSNETANMNGEGFKAESSSTTLFDRIARWGTSLLSNNDSSGRHAGDTGTKNVTRNKSRTHDRSGNDPNFGGGVGIANRLNYLAQDIPAKKSIQTNADQISVGMHSRMLLMSSAFQSSDMQSSSNLLDAEATDKKRGLDPIGPLPHIEPDILPDITTFRLLINGESLNVGFILPLSFLVILLTPKLLCPYQNSDGTSWLDHFCKTSRRLVTFARRVLF